MRIVLTGGATGGHAIPFAPIIEALRTVYSEQRPSLPVYLEPTELTLTFMGIVTPETQKMLSAYDVKAIHVPSGKLRRYVSSLTILDLLFRLPFGIVYALVKMWRIMPDVVISKGGYGSLPTALAAAFYRIPVLLHESDAVPGKSNHALSRVASAIALGYSSTRDALGVYARKAVITGNPVRAQLRQLSNRDGKRAMQIPENEFVLLVFGGSQGAQQINEALLASLPKIITDTTVVHITGPKQFATVQTVAKELLAHSPRQSFYRIYGYLDDTMLYAIAAADAVVTRAGSSLAELAAARKPMLIIPLDGAASDHQRKNAQIFEASGAALVLDPTNMGRNLFEQNISRLRNDEQLRNSLVANMAHLDFPGSARAIAALALQLAQGLRPSTAPSR